MKEVGRMDCPMGQELKSIQMAIHILEISIRDLKTDKMDYLFGANTLNFFSIKVVSKKVRYLVKGSLCLEIRLKCKDYLKTVISVNVFYKILNIVLLANFRKENYRIKLLLIFFKVKNVYRGSFNKVD